MSHLLIFHLLSYNRSATSAWMDSLFFSTGQSVSSYAHFPWDVKPKVSLLLSLSPSLAVGEGCYCSGKWESLYKYSQGFLLRLNHQSTVTVQPKQLRVSSKPESRLTGEGLSETRRGWRGGRGTLEVREGREPGSCHSQTWGPQVGARPEWK